MINFLVNTLPCFTPEERQVIAKQQHHQSSNTSSAAPTSISSTTTASSASSEKNNNKKPKKSPTLRYKVNMSQITSSSLRSTFLQSHLDDGTRQWLDKYCGDPSVAWQLVTDVMMPFLGRTNANGLTGMGSMFVLSSEQFYKLLDVARRRRSSQPPKVSDQSNDERNCDGDSSRENKRDDGAVVSVDNVFVRNRYHLPTMGGGGDDDDTPSSQQTKLSATAGSRVDENNHEEEKYASLLRSQRSRLSEKTLLDIGAGDGGCTARLAPFFKPGGVAVTEDSPVMRARLASSFGFSNVYSVEQTSDLLRGAGRTFDMVACLNVLDRCDEPLTLLKEIRESLLSRRRQLHNEEDRERTSSRCENGKSDNNDKESDDDDDDDLLPTPLLLLAVVLPWCPFVERGTQQVPPKQVLPMEGATCSAGASFEQSLDKLVTNVIERDAGFRVRSWTRVPYISQGDQDVECFALDDALLVLEPV